MVTGETLVGLLAQGFLVHLVTPLGGNGDGASFRSSSVGDATLLHDVVARVAVRCDRLFLLQYLRVSLPVSAL